MKKVRKTSELVAKKAIDSRKLAAESSKDHDARKWKKGLPLTKPAKYGPMWNPHKEEDIIRLTDEMLEWSRLDTSTNINDFPLKYDINPYDFKRIKNEYFQKTLQTVKFRVASRNRNLVNVRGCDKDIYKMELRLYDQDYKEDQDDQIARRVAGIKESLGNITIIDHMLEEK